MYKFTHKIEFVEYDDSREEHLTKTYYEHKEVMVAISSLDHKYAVLEEKYRKLSNSYNELVRMKVVENADYWKNKYYKLLEAVKSVDEEKEVTNDKLE